MLFVIRFAYLLRSAIASSRPWILPPALRPDTTVLIGDCSKAITSAISSFLLLIETSSSSLSAPTKKPSSAYAALKAGIPILLYGVDYKKRRIQCTKTIIPNGNIDDQMHEIKIYFKDFQGKKPENFCLGDI